MVQRMAAVAIGGLALGDTDPCSIKHALVELGALPPLIDMMRLPEKGDEESVRASLLALNALVLGDTHMPKVMTTLYFLLLNQIDRV